MKNIAVTTSEHPFQKDITLLSVKGFIDTTTAPEFERTFQSVLAEKKFRLVIDLKGVDYISSAGWGIFVGEIKRIRGQQGNLFLTGMCAEVAEAYELLQFNTIIKSFPDVDEAVQKGFGAKVPASKAVSRVSEPRTPSVEAVPAVPSGPVSVMAPPRRSGLSKLFRPWTWFDRS
ncbi:MAG TPA: STAS domain-containing protein [bacterium]|nr:STAS domain-containing protein [bacterium]